VEIKIDLYGWADSFADDLKIRFALQLAFYSVNKNCDWLFDITKNGGMVNRPWNICVYAERQCMGGYNGDKSVREFEIKRINFDVNQLTLGDIYSNAKKALEGIK